MNYSKQSLQFQIGQIGDSEKRILKYGKQLTSFELQRSSCFLKKSPSNQCTISLDGEKIMYNKLRKLKRAKKKT